MARLSARNGVFLLDGRPWMLRGGEFQYFRIRPELWRPGLEKLKAAGLNAISSYGSQTETSGVVRILKDLEEPIAGKHVLIVEDIVDSGLTLHYLLEVLRTRNPASLRVCTLIDKVKERAKVVAPVYIGFQVADRFVVGYGLDYAQYYRNLPYIGVLKPEVYEAAPEPSIS